MSCARRNISVPSTLTLLSLPHLQALYAVTELNEQDFLCMFDASLYVGCREKYYAVGTYMTEKGCKTKAEVMQEEHKEKEMPMLEAV
ncbi:hypothetical protein CLOM_g5754 [Closterium sp. NIES-68]|nr:hypothetical protein CLOM_g5754 [Closterium sp. NIES-68]GJP73802.1 hypothetical protein CLOP_g4484 [Closterium sp. NIES-67]